MEIFNSLSGYYRTAYNDRGDTPAEIDSLTSPEGPNGKPRKPKARVNPESGELEYFDNKAKAFLPLATEKRRTALRKVIRERSKVRPFRFTYVDYGDRKSVLTKATLVR